MVRSRSKSFSLLHEDSVIDRIIWFLTVAWIAASYIFSTESYGAYVLLGITIIILALYCLQNHWVVRIKHNMLFAFMIAFAFFCFLSSVWSLSPSSSIQQGITITEIMICLAVFQICFQDKDGVWKMLNAVKWAGFVVVIYSFIVYGIDGMRAVLASGGRLGTEFANINSIGMVAAISVIIVIYEQLYFRRNFISILFGILNVVVIAASGSRKAFLMMLIGLIFLLLFKLVTKNILKTVIRYIILAAGLIVALQLILSLDMFSGVMGRMDGFWALITGEGEVDASTQERDLLIQIGWKYFLQSPIIGFGMGASGTILNQTIGKNTYFHNNYIEVMCGGGIFALILYYSMYVYCIYFLLRTRLRDPLSKLVIILILINIIMDYAAVTYNTKSNYIYLLFFFLQSCNCRKEVKRNEYKKSTQSFISISHKPRLPFSN